jgi:hypothetical protein
VKKTMAKPRVTATDRLQNVIEVVELGRRTGLLSVERGAGQVVEEGEIYFMSGRAIYAAVAHLRGREALSVLARWGECRFAFDPNAPRPTPNVSGVLPSLDMVEHTRGVRPPSTPPPPQSGPFGGPSAPLPAPQSGPYSPPDTSSGAWRVPPPSSYPASHPSSYGAPPGGNLGQMPGQMGQMPGAPPMTDPRAGSQPLYPQAPSQSSPSYSQPGASTPRREGDSGHIYGASQVLMRRPRRAPDVRDLMTIVTTYNLSRGHRTILLLADGEHTVLDLARLSSKSVDEVAQLLGELEQFGLVYYYS